MIRPYCPTQTDYWKNWALRSRVDDGTRSEYGWSYRMAQIQIILLQEIRDLLVAQASKK